MTRFVYKARISAYEQKEGSLDAENLSDAVRKINRWGYTPVDVAVAKEPAAVPVNKARPGMDLSFWMVRRAQVVLFVRKLSDLTDAGIPIPRILELIEQQTRSDYFRNVVRDIKETVKDGGSLSFALSKYPEVFPSVYVHLIGAGELTGNLSVVLERLAEFAEHDQETRAQIAASLAYPLLIVATGILTVIVLFSWVIPKVTLIFSQMQQTLPLSTRVLLLLSRILTRFWWVFGGITLLGALAARQVLRDEEKKLWGHRQVLRCPVLGDFIRHAEIARFARTLSTLLANGVVILTALEAAGNVFHNAVFKKTMEEVKDAVGKGASLSEALKGNSLFPETALQMIEVGTESGEIHKSLERLADYYERSCRRFMKTITSLIEPVLILAVGAIVAFIVFSILMPLFQINFMVR